MASVVNLISAILPCGTNITKQHLLMPDNGTMKCQTSIEIRFTHNNNKQWDGIVFIIHLLITGFEQQTDVVFMIMNPNSFLR